MAESAPGKPKTKWLWLLLIALLAVLLLIVLLDPSGDADEGRVDDPIVTGDLAEEPAGPVGEGLPGQGASDPAGGEPVATGSAPAPDTQPADAVAVPPPPPLEQQ